jgi:hypothetical protein
VGGIEDSGDGGGFGGVAEDSAGRVRVQVADGFGWWARSGEGTLDGGG